MSRLARTVSRSTRAVRVVAQHLVGTRRVPRHAMLAAAQFSARSPSAPRTLAPVAARAFSDAATAMRDALAAVAEGTTLIEQQKVPEAIAAFERALSLQPDLVDALMKLGDTYSLLGETDKAKDMYRRVLAADKSNGQAVQRLGYLLLGHATQVAHVQEALDVFSAALGDGGSHEPENLYGRGMCYQKLGNGPAAAADFEAAAACIPGFAPPLYHLGETLLAMGEFARAKDALDRYLEHAPTYYGALGSLVKVPVDGIVAQGLFQRAHAHLFMENDDAALADLNEAIAKFGDAETPALAFHMRGQVHEKKKNWWKAIEDQTKALDKDADLAPAYLHRSRCYEAVHFTAEASDDKREWTARANELAKDYAMKGGASQQ